MPIPLPWLLRRVNQRYRAVVRDRLAEQGLGALPQPGSWALTALARGAHDAAQLVAEMGVSKQAVSKLVDVLVDGGFVDRKVNKGDRRRTELVLSAQGKRAARVIEDAIRATEQSFATELGAAPFGDLVALLNKLATPGE
ncbi:MAG: MarR family winged helix-turn-helix transcriptional regulator [Actinomycetota bacterium]|nr:MarR family winged helix-turn-helix transcriptional regulator [Actinomycetota bacterium]